MPSRAYSNHQRLRRLLPRPSGEPCPFCRQPMQPGDALDLDHVTPVAAGGEGGALRWSHAKCNRAEGGRLGNERRYRKVRSREW